MSITTRIPTPAHVFHASTAFLTVPTGNSSEAQNKRALWQHLSPLQRALLGSDGSFTLLLAALYGEAIKTELLAQLPHRTKLVDEQLQLEPDDPVLKRTVLLKTASTNRPVTYAESSIVLSRLSKSVREGLQEGSRPIGLLLRQSSLETHRVLHDWGECPRLHPATKHFGSATLLFRQYVIIAHGLPIMKIAEYFPYETKVSKGQL